MALSTCTAAIRVAKPPARAGLPRRRGYGTAAFFV